MKWYNKLLTGVAVLATLALAAQAQIPGVNSTLNSAFNLVYEASTSKPSYSATQIYTPALNATDTCSLSGSSTRTIRVRRVIFGGTSTAVQTDPVALLKRSTAYTAGQGLLLPRVPFDSTNLITGSTTNTSTVNMSEYWTGNPTLGTLVGALADVYVTFANQTTGTGSLYTFELGQRTSPVFLRGIAQQLAVNLNGQTFTQVSCTFEWTEDSDT